MLELVAGVIFVIAIVVALNKAGEYFFKKDNKIHLSNTRRRDLEMREKRRSGYSDTDRDGSQRY